MEERRHRVLTDEDKDAIVEHLLKDENIDKFAAAFETRWRDYFYRGLGKGIVAYAWRGLILFVCYLAGFGMAKGWKPW